jgi:hypothetical protein
MLENCYADGKLVVVDLGYAKDATSQEAFDALRAAGLARRNFSWVGYGDRLFANIPSRKVGTLLSKLPIVSGSTYWQSTHHWRGLACGDLPSPPAQQ